MKKLKDDKKNDKIIILMKLYILIGIATIIDLVLCLTAVTIKLFEALNG